MKNKYLLTSFLPMLVTAGLIILAPEAREAFYKSVSTENIKDNSQVRKTAAKKATGNISAANMAAGQKVYTLTCLTCHQATGAGIAGMNPPLIKSPYVTGDKNRLIKIVLNGLSDKIVVNGEEYTNMMPAQSTLTDQEVADVLTYVRNSFGNKAAAVKAIEVKKLRAAN